MAIGSDDSDAVPTDFHPLGGGIELVLVYDLKVHG
jgi:hypothetical protein